MQIEHGEKLFEFTTFDNWCDTAQHKFKSAGVTSNDVLSVDQRGRVCAWGTHFMTAAADAVYPIEVFRLRADMTANGVANSAALQRSPMESEGRNES